MAKIDIEATLNTICPYCGAGVGEQCFHINRNTGEKVHSWQWHSGRVILCSNTQRGTVCLICQRELHRRIYPDFRLCSDCRVAVRVAGTLRQEPDRLGVYSDQWVEEHANNPIAKDIAKHTAQVVVDTLGEGTHSRILDIGCGSGLLVNTLVERSLGYIAGIDWSEHAIAYASQHYYGEFLQVNVEQGLDIGVIFDLAVASHLLEHLENPHEFLQSVKGLLEPDGYLVIAVPNLDWWKPKSAYRSVSTLFDPEHVVGYSPKGLRKLLEANGYEVARMLTRTHRLAILTALGITVYGKLFGGNGNASVKSGVKSGYVKATGEGVLAKLLAWGMTPWNRLSERELCGMELIAVARKEA